MPDRAAIFSSILARNDLRRTAKLPLLDVRRTFEAEVNRQLWAEHVRGRHALLQAEVLRVEREKHGPTYPASAGGRWAIAVRVQAALVESFRAPRAG